MPKSEKGFCQKAEIDSKEYQVKSFLLRCKEDGGISIADLQELATIVGATNSKHLTTEVELIREIQKSTQHRPCFRTTYQQHCEDPEYECPWREKCQKILAAWCR